MMLGGSRLKFLKMCKYYLVVLFCLSCNNHDNVSSSNTAINGHLYTDIVGQKYHATGFFSSKQKDSVESGTWLYINQDTPLALYGNYVSGALNGSWNIALNNGTIMSSSWNKYTNKLTHFEFSTPFSYDEIPVNSFYFKLRNLNDSLGRISIIIGVSDTIIKDDELKQFGVNSEAGLRRQGYEFSSKSSEIDKNDCRYFFSEYSMKKDTAVNLRLYHTYGYLPSKKHFIEFTLYHDGPHEDLVKIIYGIMVGSIYVDNERYFNPYTK
jgi:hypothetical protein